MASNERENIRKEKKRIKEAKTRRTVFIILLLILSCLIIMKVCEINIDTIKNSISTSSTIKSNYPFSTDSSSNLKLKMINSKLALFSDSNIKILNPSNANIEYSCDFGYSSPVFKNAGLYILTYDQGGTNFRVDTTTKNLYEKTVNKSIICANICKNCSVAYAILDDECKSKIVIMSKNENKKFELDVNDGYVTNITLSPNGTICSYVTVNSKNSIMISTVHTIDVSSGKELSSIDYNNSDIYALQFVSNDDIAVICHDAICYIKNGKHSSDILKKQEASIIEYKVTVSNELVVMYSDFENSTNTSISYINSSGKIKNTYKFKEEIKDFSTNSNEITVLTTNKIKVYSLTKPKEKTSVNCDNSIKNAITVSSKQYVLSGRNISVIE